MGRKRDPERDKSLQRYLDSGGKLTLDELAEAAGVSKGKISKWKYEDKWTEQLNGVPRKQGGQKGNQNAAGRTPKKDGNQNAAGRTPKKDGNKNAVTHGAYVQVGFDDITPEEADKIKSMSSEPGQSQQRMMEELQSLLVRKAYLESLLEQYTAPEAENKYYTDKILHMVVPKSEEEIIKETKTGVRAGGAKDPERGREKLKTAMKNIIKSSAFERAMKIEAELNKLHGRIIKQIDSMKSLEMEEQRLKLEERKYKLAKQKLTGEIEVDEGEEEEIIDDLIREENE